MIIFVMAAVGALAFTSLLQGWLLVKNKWYELPLLALATILLFEPATIMMVLPQGLPVKLTAYGTGLSSLAVIIAIQLRRKQRLVTATS